jgi:hypothetical protein
MDNALVNFSEMQEHKKSPNLIQKLGLHFVRPEGFEPSTF